MSEEKNIIKEKTRELIELYPFDEYKEAEYLACRLIAEQSIEQIKSRLQTKIRATIKNISVTKNPEAKERMELGLKRKLNIVRFLEKDLL